MKQTVKYDKDVRSRRGNNLMYLERAKKVKGTLMVAIPKEVALNEHIEANDIVEIEIKKKPNSLGFGMFPGLTPMKKEDKLDVKWSKFDS